MTNSRNKGKRGEIELGHELRRIFGVDARRGRQFSGSDESPDVVGLDGVHIECKRVEALRLYEAVEQSVADAGPNVPVVCHRRSRKPWLLVVRLDDVPWLVRTLEDSLDD